MHYIAHSLPFSIYNKFHNFKRKKWWFLSLSAFRIPKQYMKVLLFFFNKVKLT